MIWIDAAVMMFACVMAIHLGLVDAVLRVLHKEDMPVVTCPKCLTWWSVMTVCLLAGCNVTTSAAISFLFAYMAIWFDLFLGFLDKQYEKSYERLYQERAERDTEDTDIYDPSARDTSESADVVSEMRLSDKDFK